MFFKGINIKKFYFNVKSAPATKYKKNKQWKKSINVDKKRKWDRNYGAVLGINKKWTSRKI